MCSNTVEGQWWLSLRGRVFEIALEVCGDQVVAVRAQSPRDSKMCQTRLSNLLCVMVRCSISELCLGKWLDD